MQRSAAAESFVSAALRSRPTSQGKIMMNPRSPHPAIAAERVAFITGGASGIGLAVASRLLDHAMRVALIDRHDEGEIPPSLPAI